LSYAADKQKDSEILPMPTDIVSVGNYPVLTRYHNINICTVLMMSSITNLK